MKADTLIKDLHNAHSLLHWIIVNCIIFELRCNKLWSLSTRPDWLAFNQLYIKFVWAVNCYIFFILKIFDIYYHLKLYWFSIRCKRVVILMHVFINHNNSSNFIFIVIRYSNVHLSNDNSFNIFHWISFVI